MVKIIPLHHATNTRPRTHDDRDILQTLIPSIEALGASLEYFREKAVNTVVESLEEIDRGIVNLRKAVERLPGETTRSMLEKQIRDLEDTITATRQELRSIGK